MTDTLPDQIADALGHAPRDPKLFERALTHPSVGPDNYQRLEFLGDRVLGLIVAAWLYERFPGESEGELSKRNHVLVSRETCAAIGREIGLNQHLRLGKQARDDGASGSDNVLGDAVEALIGALHLEGGLAPAEAFIRAAWADQMETMNTAPRHPKSALQDWAAAHHCRPPIYTLAGRSGPDHAPLFTVSVEIPKRAEASGEGASKQEAETEAARRLLERLT